MCDVLHLQQRVKLILSYPLVYKFREEKKGGIFRRGASVATSRSALGCTKKQKERNVLYTMTADSRIQIAVNIQINKNVADDLSLMTCTSL